MRGSRFCGFWGVVVSEFDNGNGLQHGTSDALGPALPRPADDVSWSVALRVPMRSDSTDNNDDQEQGGNDASDAV